MHTCTPYTTVTLHSLCKLLQIAMIILLGTDMHNLVPGTEYDGSILQYYQIISTRIITRLLQ